MSSLSRLSLSHVTAHAAMPKSRRAFQKCRTVLANNSRRRWPPPADAARRCGPLPARGLRPACPPRRTRARAPARRPPCRPALLHLFSPLTPHLQCSSSLATDIKELYSAGQRATSGARESPLTMPFILGERDTKDSAHTLLNMPKNKRRRLDKNLKRQVALSLLCSPLRVCVRADADSAL